MENQTVKVIACSTACIPEGLAEELGICVIPMNLVIDGRTYRDGIDITGESFYGSAMYENPGISTSAPTVGSYIEAFESFADEHDSVLCITIARGMSASYPGRGHGGGEGGLDQGRGHGLGKRGFRPRPGRPGRRQEGG